MSKEDNDNYNEEEYHFAVEPDEVEQDDLADDSAHVDEAPVKSKFELSKFIDIDKIKLFLQENVPIRNAIIAVIALILLIVIYQFTSGMVTKKKSKTQQPQNIIQRPKGFTEERSKLQPMLSKQQNSQTLSVAQKDLEKETKVIQNNLDKVKQAQDIIYAKISTLSSDSLKMSTEYQELSEKLDKLSIQVEKLASVVEDQSQTIMNLSTRRVYHTRQMHESRASRPQYMKYFVKAVIPGRAWLIAENGSTLTVRKGSMIPGYGVVTMVDVSQGRVLTNSGRIISFAQNDS